MTQYKRVVDRKVRLGMEWTLPCVYIEKGFYYKDTQKLVSEHAVVLLGDSFASLIL